MIYPPLCIDLFCGLGGWTDGFLAEGWNVVGFDITRHVYQERIFPDSTGVKASGVMDMGVAQVGVDSRLRSFNYANQCAVRESPLTGRMMRYPAQLVLQDVLTIHGSQFRNADIIVASPPCQQYSWLAMPWSRSKDPNNSKAAKALRAKWEFEGPDNRLFDACFRIQREANITTGYICETCGAPDEPRTVMTAPPGHQHEDDLAEYAPCPDCLDKSKRHIPLIVENVRGAQEWVGRAPWNYGSFYLWGDVPALMPQAKPAKVPGFRFDGSGRSFQSAAVEVTKTPGRSLSKGTAAKFGTHNMGSADKIMAELGASDAVKIGGDWFRDPACHSSHGSKSSAREAASAMIAKIPLPLSTHIARVYWPIDLPRPASTQGSASGTSAPASVLTQPVSV